MDLEHYARQPYPLRWLEPFLINLVPVWRTVVLKASYGSNELRVVTATPRGTVTLILKSPEPVIAIQPKPATEISCADFLHESPVICDIISVNKKTNTYFKVNIFHRT